MHAPSSWWPHKITIPLNPPSPSLGHHTDPSQPCPFHAPGSTAGGNGTTYSLHVDLESFAGPWPHKLVSTRSEETHTSSRNRTPLKSGLVSSCAAAAGGAGPRTPALPKWGQPRLRLLHRAPTSTPGPVRCPGVRIHSSGRCVVVVSPSLVCVEPAPNCFYAFSQNRYERTKNNGEH